MSNPRPNILWYCTDQQRFDTIAALGNPHVVTPTLDRFVADGTAFTHACCQSPICTPSRASFMTGLYPSRVHNCRNGNESFPGHPPLISRRIADAGYDCGLIGKFHLQSSGHRTEPRLDDGYRYWKFSHAPRDDWPAGHDYADWVREQGGDLDAMRKSADRVSPELHQTKWATDRAIDFIDEQRDGPWFLTINVYDPHPPFIPPRRYAERFDPANMPGPHFRESDLATQARLQDVDFQTTARHPDEFDGQLQQALYYAMIAQVDEQFGRLLQFLDDAGQRENTAVIFTSDHGEMLGDHGLLFKGCRFYEGLVRVPLLFRWPGRVAAGLQSDALVELLDLSATLLDIAGVDQPQNMQGQSLLPVLTGDAPPGHHRDFVRCEYYDALDAAFIGSGAPDVPTQKPGFSAAADETGSVHETPAASTGDNSRASSSGSYGTMYRDRRYKLVVYHGLNTGELYDLEADPWEFDNLWDLPAHQALKTELLLKNFDAAMLTGVDVGTRRIAPM
ncbi:MAG: sulfatase [Planctomycetaceae bacterium]